MKPVQQVVALGFPLIKYFLNIDTSYHQTVLKVLVLYKHCAQIREDQAYLITYSFISCGMFSNTLVDRRLIRFCLHQLCKDTHMLLVNFLSTLKRGKSLAQVYRKEGMCCKCVIVRLTYMLLITYAEMASYLQEILQLLLHVLLSFGWRQSVLQ